MPFVYTKRGLFTNIGKTYTDFQEADLDLADVGSLLDSMKSVIRRKRNRFVLRKGMGNSLPSMASHVGMSLFYKYARNIGFLKIQHQGWDSGIK